MLRKRAMPGAVPDRVLRRWPKDKPLPTHWEKMRRGLIPCVNCRRVLLDGLPSQAVVVMSSGRQVVSLRCRACGHSFKMPVLER